MKGLALLAAIAAALIVPATAMADDSSTVSTDAKSGCTTYQVKVWRDGVTGGRLWTYTVTAKVCYAGGRITSKTITRLGQGTSTFGYDGLLDSSTWGGVGQNRTGWFQQARFSSAIVQFADVDTPSVSLTVYADGHWTHTQSCGC